MQRIDEDTYIDDTLVTCAEYQLFIDEMRGQEKYCQPDHWSSYQFPDGQAREPILGVRYADAVMFSSWLTNREMSKWKFRLPTQGEMVAIPVNLTGLNPIGVWIGENYQFAWIGIIPEDARALSDNIDLVTSIGLADSPGYVINRARGSAALVRARARALDLDLMLDLAHHVTVDLNLVFDRIPALDLGTSFARLSTQEYDPSLELARSRNLQNAHTAARHIARDLIYARDRIFPFNRDDKHGRTLNQKFDGILDIYVDILTLQERIAGRSPAFEGIRLVKERIR